MYFNVSLSALSHSKTNFLVATFFKYIIVRILWGYNYILDDDPVLYFDFSARSSLCTIDDFVFSPHPSATIGSVFIVFSLAHIFSLWR